MALPEHSPKTQRSRTALVPLLLGAVFVALTMVRFPSGAGANRSGDLTPPGERQGAPGAQADLAGRDLDGKSWSLRGHRGRVVLVNYWATWCSPCRKETPGLVRVAKRFAGQGLAVVGVSLDTGPGAAGIVRDFARRYGVPYPLVLGQGHAAMITPSVELVQAVPTTLLIDRWGRVAKMIVGAVEEAAVATDVQELLAEPAKESIAQGSLGEGIFGRGVEGVTAFAGMGGGGL